jgi:hypothetical protein
MSASSLISSGEGQEQYLWLRLGGLPVNIATDLSMWKTEAKIRLLICVAMFILDVCVCITVKPKSCGDTD